MIHSKCQCRGTIAGYKKSESIPRAATVLATNKVLMQREVQIMLLTNTAVPRGIASVA
jgi:hypothetical protein